MQRIDGIALDEVISGVDHSPDNEVSDKSREKPLASASTSDGADETIAISAEPAQQHLASDESSDSVSAGSHDPNIDFQNLRGRARCRWVADIGIQVAEAIGYAHAQGVLHRDVKPGNLLLDPRGKVWVTDFGLATVLQAEKEHCPKDVAGTLRFMAPEHLSGEQNARSDIYSLGLTLYELLTLQPAFADQDRAGLIDKINRGEIPPPREIRPSIPQDLEAIVMKAIACDPQHRYDSAEMLAADLRRFVEGRPVHARPIGTLGRVRRWAHRNPAIASLTAALLLVVLSSFLLVSAKWREAVAENHRAEDNLSLALESMDQILERFASGWMAQPSGMAVQVNAANGEAEAPAAEVQMVVSNYSAAVLQDALKFYDQFARQNATNPQLQRDTAKVHRRVADIYQRLGQFDQAEQAYRRCLQILESQPTGDEADLALEQAATRNQLGLTMHASSRFEHARGEYLRAKEILSKKQFREVPDCQAELARTNSNLGHSQWLMLRYDEAKQSHRQAVSLLESLVQRAPDDASYRLALASAYRTYLPLASSRGRDGEQQRIRAAGIAILEELVQDYPNVPDYQCELSEMLTVTSYRSRGSRSGKEPVTRIQRGIEVARQVSLAHPSIPRYRAALAHALKEMARLLQKSQPDDADQHFTESVQIYRSLARDFADIPAYHTLLAMALREHARHVRDSGRASEALTIVREGVAEQEVYVDLRPDNRFGKNMLVRLYEELAKTLTALDEKEDAEKAAEKAERLRGDTVRRGRERS